MPQQINIIFTVAELAAIDGALDALETNCPFRVNIPAGEKDEEQAMDNKRYPFVKNVIENYAPANAALQPGYMPLGDAARDLQLYDQFTPRVNRMMSIFESYVDTQWLAGVEAYKYFRTFYGLVETAKANNFPGADAIYNDLKQLYEGQGPHPQP